MKKFLISIGLALGVTFAASAQNHNNGAGLLNAQSLYISNSVTFVTNLSSSISVATGATNIIGVIWTNNFGQTMSATNITPAYTNSPSITTNIGASYNLLKTANLAVNRDIIPITGNATNGCIYVHTVPAASGSANATNKFTLEFVRLPDGVNEDTTSTAITFSSADNSAVTTTGGSGFYFPFPVSLTVGCKAIKLRKVYGVAPTAAASDYWIDKIEYCTFIP